MSTIKISFMMIVLFIITVDGFGQKAPTITKVEPANPGEAFAVPGGEPLVMRVHGNNLQNLISVQALLNRQLKHNISLVMEKSVFSKKASTQRKLTINAAPDAAEGRYALQFTHSALPQNNLTKGSFDVKKAEIHSIQVKNSSIKGGAEIEGTVTLKNPAPAGGIKVKITGVSNQLVKSPTFPLTIPQGKKSTSFKAPTKPVATQTKATFRMALENTVYKESMDRSVTLLPAPDLIIRKVTFEPSPLRDSDYGAKFIVRIKNTGKASAQIPAGDLLTWRYDGGVGEHYLPNQPRTLGAGMAFSVEIRIDNDFLTAGDHTLALQLDKRNKIDEINENNNAHSAAIKIRVGPKPDMEISNIEVKTSNPEPDKVKYVLKVTVKNIGTKDTLPYGNRSILGFSINGAGISGIIHNPPFKVGQSMTYTKALGTYPKGYPTLNVFVSANCYEKELRKDNNSKILVLNP